MYKRVLALGAFRVPMVKRVRHYVFVYVYICVEKYTQYINKYIYIYIFLYIYMCTYIYMYVHIHRTSEQGVVLTMLRLYVRRSKCWRAPGAPRGQRCVRVQSQEPPPLGCSGGLTTWANRGYVGILEHPSFVPGSA